MASPQNDHGPETMTPLPFRLSAILALLSSAATPALEAQTGWMPLSVDMGKNLTGPNRAAAIARLERIEALLKQVPELAHPDGFEIKPFFTGHRNRLGLNNSEHADYVVEYQFRIHFYVPKYEGNPAIGAIVFMVNGEESDPGWMDPQGRALHHEQARWPLTPYSVATYGVSASGLLQAGENFNVSSWFTPGRVFPWRPVTREEYYTAFIATAEGNNGEKRAQYEKRAEKTEYQRWLEAAPQRKEEREAAIATAARFQSKAAAESLRTALETAEKESGAALKQNESTEREESKTAFKGMDGVRAELARMTPAERQLPTILDGDPTRTQWTATGTSLRDKDTISQSVHRLLTPNYDFWRGRKSITEVRTIHVYMEGANNPLVTNAVYQAYKKFDWRALQALVDEPPQ